MIASSVTITDERKQTMDFTDPYFDAVQLIAVKADSKIASFDDLKKRKVGVQTGTTGDEAVTKLLGKTSTTVKRFESTPLALKELEAGGVDAVVADNGVVINYVTNNAGAKFKTVSDKDFEPEQYGFAVKKGNAELLGKLNQRPGRHQGRRQLRHHLRQVLRRPARSRRSPRAGSLQVRSHGDGSSLGDPRRLRAAVRQRPVDDGPAHAGGDRRRPRARRRCRPGQQFGRRADAGLADPGLGPQAAARRHAGLRHVLPRHAAVRADPAGALCADAGADPPRRRPADERRRGTQLSARTMAPSSPARWP